jgi:hypothetical protein
LNESGRPLLISQRPFVNLPETRTRRDDTGDNGRRVGAVNESGECVGDGPTCRRSKC